MKKLICILLAAILVCGTVSCGENKPEETEKTDLSVSNPTENEGKGEETKEIADTKAETDELSAETAAPETDAQSPETESPVAQNGYVCAFDNGTVIEIGSVAEAVINAIGTPQNVAEAPSCVHEGTDRIYSFNGFSVTTSPDGKGNDRVHEVVLTSDAVLLQNGISIGSPLDAVTAAFGTDYTEQFGVLSYIKDNVKISIVLDSDSCVSSLAITAAE